MTPPAIRAAAERAGSGTGGRAMRRHVHLDGRGTSIKLEPEFWAHLEAAARERELNVSQMIRIIVGDRPVGNRASAIRVWCLRDAAAAAEHAGR